MRSLLIKSAAPLILLCALVFLSGAASLAVAASGTPAADACCAQESDRPAPAPASEGECADPGCFCPFCNVPLLNTPPLPLSSAQDPAPALCTLAAGPSAGYLRAIDYPPEAA